MRVPGWESRLAEVIEASRHRPFDLGAHDCFTFSCAVIETLTGVNHWQRFAGYSTKREVRSLLVRHGSTFEAAFDRVFATAHGDRRLVRRGDIVMVEEAANGEKHLGVCAGTYIAVLGDRGLRCEALSVARCCWRID